MGNFYTEEAVKRWAKSNYPCPNPEHQSNFEEHGFCGGCGESKSMQIRPGDSAALWRTLDGEVIAGIVGATIHILLPDKVKNS